MKTRNQIMSLLPILLTSFTRRKHLLVLLIALTLIAINQNPRAISAGPVPTESTVVLDTAAATTLPGTFQLVRGEPGDETNPHVDCDVASFTYDDFQGSSTIHYHDLSTGADNVVPGNEVDLLSDISGSRVAYTEVTFSGDTVRVFDTNALTTTIIPGFGMSTPSIGGNLVAFEDRSSSITGPGAVDIDALDLSSGTIMKLAHDSFRNLKPEVSPNGNAVIWAQCPASEVGCNIYGATRTSTGAFTTRALTTDSHETWFDTSTNGEIAVYVSDRTGERDIYYQPLAGGTEVHLAIPGDQRHPTISGDLISFESGPSGATNIFVYDMRSGRLYQVTTGSPDYRLSEISVCGDTGRIVYVNVGIGAFDVSAFEFQVPTVPGNTEQQLNDLIALIRSFNLPAGTTNSLIRKLQNAIDASNASDTATACTLLTSFINECQAQAGKKLTPAQSTQLITAASQIKTELGCQ